MGCRRLRRGAVRRPGPQRGGNVASRARSPGTYVVSIDMKWIARATGDCEFAGLRSGRGRAQLRCMTTKKAATKPPPKQVAGTKKDAPAKGEPKARDEAPAREPRKVMPFDL